MTKSVLIFSLSVIISISAFCANNLDSTWVKERNSMYNTYNEFKSSKPAPTKEDYDNMIVNLENIINKDNQLIDTARSYTIMIDTLKSRIVRSDTTSIALTKTHEATVKSAGFYKTLTFVFGIISVILLIVLIVIFTGKGGATKKQKEEHDKLIASEKKLNEELKAISEKLSESDNTLKSSIFEKEELNKKLFNTENNLTNTKNEIAAKLPGLENQITEKDMRINMLNNEVSTWISKNNDTELKVFNLNNEIEGLKLQLHQAENSSISNTNDVQKIEQYEQKINDLLELSNRLISEKSDVESNLINVNKKLEETIAENASLTLKLSETSNNISVDNTELDKIVEENKKIIEAKKLEIEEKQKLIIELTKELGALKKSSSIEDDKVGKLTKKYDLLELAHKHLNVDFKELEVDYYKLKEQHKESKKQLDLLNDHIDADFYKKVDELDIRKVKLERIDRLYSQKVITREEYESFKNKLINEITSI